MPSSRMWPDPLAVGTPVLVSDGSAARSAGTIIRVELAGPKAQDRQGPRSKWRYLVRKSEKNELGQRVGSWYLSRSVVPVDKSDQAQLLEWLDG